MRIEAPCVIARDDRCCLEHRWDPVRVDYPAAPGIRVDQNITQQMIGRTFFATAAEDLRNSRHVPNDLAVAHFGPRRSILPESHCKKVYTRPDTVFRE